MTPTIAGLHPEDIEADGDGWIWGDKFPQEQEDDWSPVEDGLNEACAAIKAAGYIIIEAGNDPSSAWVRFVRTDPAS